MTRSFCAIAHGNFRAAFASHALGPVLFGALLIAVPLLAYQAISGRRVEMVNEMLYGKRPAYLFAAALFVFQAIRLAALFASGQLWMDFHASLLMRAAHLG
jgi:hypothetical protein